VLVCKLREFDGTTWCKQTPTIMMDDDKLISHLNLHTIQLFFLFHLFIAYISSIITDYLLNLGRSQKHDEFLNTHILMLREVDDLRA
jgi:hypothetical protein